MPKARGRPPIIPPKPADPPAAISALWPPDKTSVPCELCQEPVQSIAAHLRLKHPVVHLEDYTAQFPSAPLEGEIDPTKEAARAVTVTAEEIAGHPGGRDAALTEKLLEERERSAYRSDVLGLLEQGHTASYQVAAVAYWMTLARRTRMQIENVRGKTGGEIYHGEAVDTLHDLDGKISRVIGELEKIRAQRLREDTENQLAAIQHELGSAESWVQEHIGEFQERCPGCGQMLLPPALPHWAFEPLRTEHGDVLWPVWSRELWSMVLSGDLELWQMAYILRTSPEGLKYTAGRRGDAWPEHLDVAGAEITLRARLNMDDRTYKQELRPIVGEGGSNGRLH